MTLDPTLNKLLCRALIWRSACRECNNRLIANNSSVPILPSNSSSRSRGGRRRERTKSPERISSSSGNRSHRRRRDAVVDAPVASDGLRPLLVVHAHRHRQRLLHLPHRVRGPCRAGATQTLTLAKAPRISVTPWLLRAGGRARRSLACRSAMLCRGRATAALVHRTFGLRMLICAALVVGCCGESSDCLFYDRFCLVAPNCAVIEASFLLEIKFSSP
jgi:hypothetical protein